MFLTFSIAFLVLQTKPISDLFMIIIGINHPLCPTIPGSIFGNTFHSVAPNLKLAEIVWWIAMVIDFSIYNEY